MSGDTGGIQAAPGLTGGAVRRKTDRRRLAREIEVAKEKCLVPHDWTAETEPALLILECADLGIRRIRNGGRGNRRNLADQALVASHPVPGTAERVRAALGDCVDGSAGESSLSHVVRRDDDLDLLNRVKTDGLTPCLTARDAGDRNAEDIVVDGPVDLHVVVPIVAAGDRDGRVVAGGVGSRVDERRGSREVENTPLNGRQVLKRFLRNVRRRASTGRVDDGRDRSNGDAFREGCERKLEVHGPICAERYGDVGLGLVLEPAQRGGHSVRTAGADAGHLEVSLGAGDRFVLRSGRLVRGCD